MIWLALAALAQEHPGGTCAHCHDDPHRGTATATCDTCHTTADWSPTFTVADHADAAFALEGAHVEVSCGLCHSGHRLTGQPTECAGCHVDRHRGLLGDACADCHSAEGFAPVDGFDHARTGFSVVGPHEEVGCEGCHEGVHGQSLLLGAGSGCTTCHTAEHADFGACDTCHADAHATFAAARPFDHRPTGFHLERRHASQPCASCHPADGAAPVARCHTCHVDPHAGQLGMQCDDCHRADRWRLVRFDHDLSGWTLRGRHHVTACADCHTSQRWLGLSTECWDCHGDDALRAPGNVEVHRSGRVDCADCHGTWRW